MIETIVLSNYRSVGPDITVHPGRVTFFVGPNGSGKSNVLDALSFVRDAVTQGLPAAVTHRGGIDSVRRRSHGRPYDVRIQLSVRLETGPATYSFVITGDRLEEYRVKSETAVVSTPEGVSRFHREEDLWQGPPGIAPRIDEQSLALTALGGAEEFKPLADFLSQITVYSIFPDTLRTPQRFDPARPMQRHGENWVSVLRELVKDAEVKDELIKGLHKLTGDIEDIRVTSAAGYLVAEFKQQEKASKGKRWFAAAQQSDGTLRVAGLLTALLQTPPLPVIGIEEPELTVHPGALPMLYDYLHQASQQSQILVSTHSPILLDQTNLETDKVFVVERKGGKTSVAQVTEEQLEPVRKRLLSLGDLFVSGDLQLSLFPEAAEA
ncbi:MAG: hypothetical protein D6790_21575 [Caldilineae bacterium]|nr:MAG: hypothetical protein D6790_21575 [Caldilineae bacterium]